MLQNLHSLLNRRFSTDHQMSYMSKARAQRAAAAAEQNPPPAVEKTDGGGGDDGKRVLAPPPPLSLEEETRQFLEKCVPEKQKDCVPQVGMDLATPIVSSNCIKTSNNHSLHDNNDGNNGLEITF